MNRRGRAAVLFVVAAWSVALQGCYESLPVQQGVAPTVGRIELVLNDQGRAALAERLGPIVEKVEGQLVSQDANGYTISVVSVSQLKGGIAHWNGEQVTVRSDQMIGFQVRQLNKVKTIGLAAVVTVGAVIVFFGKSLLGGGTDDKTPTPGGGEPTLIRR